MKKPSLLLLTFLVITLSSCISEKPNIVFEILPGQDTIELNDTWVDAGAKLYIDGNSYNPEMSGSVDTKTLGLYEVLYTYEYEDETYSDIRYVIVVDQTPPIITLNSGIDTVKIGETWIDASATSVDNSLENLVVSTVGTVDTTRTGVYEIVYSSEDSSGNIGIAVRYVTVYD